MLTLIAPASAARLRTLFEEAGYTDANLRKHLGAPELPSRHLRNLPRLLDRTSAPLAVNTLLRWFWLGRPQLEREIEGRLSDEFLALLLESGLLEKDD